MRMVEGNLWAPLFTTLPETGPLILLLTWAHKRRASHHRRNYCGCSSCPGLQGLLDLLICVGGDNWADHRCWGNLHRLHCGHRRHSSWDSGHRSSQYFLLKPGGAGQIPYVKSY